MDIPLQATRDQISLIKELAPNFKPKEFMCPCCGECNMNKYLLSGIQKFRESVKMPVIITSGYRCVKHNRDVEGAQKSRHLLGAAVDISLRGVPFNNKHSFLDAAVKIFTGIGIGTNLLHVDIRQTRAFWTYPRHSQNVAKPT